MTPFRPVSALPFRPVPRRSRRARSALRAPRRPAREAHDRAHQLRAPLSGTLPTRLQWHPDGKRLSFLRRAGETEQPVRARGLEGHRSRSCSTAPRSRRPGDKPLPLATARAGCPTAARCSSRRWATSSRSTCASGSVRALVQSPETRGVRGGVARRPLRRLRAQERPLPGRGRERQGQTRLTQSGSDTLLNGKLDWVYEEELASRTGQAFVWSPDSASDRLPAARPGARAHLPDRRLPARAQRGRVAALSEGRRPQRGRAPRRRGASTRTAARARSGSSRSTPDDVYVLPQLGFTPDSRGVAFQHLNRAQSELELRLLPVPASPREPLGTPRTILHRELEGLGQHLRRRRTS